MVFISCSDFVTSSNFDPPSGSVLPGIETAVNFTTISCDIVSGDMNRAVVWSIKFSDKEILQITKSDWPYFIHGSLQNKLTVKNLTSNLDGAMLYCGTEREPQLANFTLRIYRKHYCVMYRVSPLYLFMLLTSGPPCFNNTSLQKNVTENDRNIMIDFGLPPLFFPVPSKIILEKEGLIVSQLENSWDISMINGSMLFFKLITRYHAGLYTLTVTYYHQENTSLEVGTSVAKLTLNVICK